MPITPAETGDGARATAPRPPPDLTAIDHDDGLYHGHADTWEDDMIRRMKTETQRQLSQVEGQKADSRLSATERAANARTLTSLQRMVAQIAKQEKDNKGARAYALENDTNYKDAVIGKLSRLVTCLAEDDVSGPTERK